VLVGDVQGRTGYENELYALIRAGELSDKVSLCGHANDMPAAYLAADIVVSASTDPEAFGRVTAEASAMGRPVIATDHGGSRETVVQGVTGLLVPPGNVVELATAIGTLLSLDPGMRIEMGQEGRAYIAGRFTVERMCADTIALYRKLLGQTR
jgi:glycosyltransferase involved in cell wall biosynthesis